MSLLFAFWNISDLRAKFNLSGSVADDTGLSLVLSKVLSRRDPIVVALIICAVAWDFRQCGKCDQKSLKSACAYAQSDQSFCLSLEHSMSAKLLTELHL